MYGSQLRAVPAYKKDYEKERRQHQYIPMAVENKGKNNRRESGRKMGEFAGNFALQFQPPVHNLGKGQYADYCYQNDCG
jgi:hypothetical protein